MASLTRKLLKSLGLSDEVIETIIEAHTDVTDALRNERDGYKTKAESITALEKERDQLKAQLDKAGDAAKVRAEFDAYKAQVETDRANAVREQALRRALKDAGVQRDEFVELLMGKADLTGAEMDGDKLKDAAALIDPLKASYGGCFATTTTQGTAPVNPPTNGQQKLTREQIEGMSEAEINANWSAVQASIGQK